jgi:N-carbamoyl-L-amino-acid hydrolase
VTRTDPLEIDPDRLRRSVDAYAEIGATDAGGLHRLALTDADARARDRLVEALSALDLDVRIDAVGNVFGRRAGTDPDAEPVLVGSHLDSQPSGGRFDGQLGVLAALETVRAMDDAGLRTRRPIEVVNWTNEEGARFETPLLGSGVYVGRTGTATARDLTDDDGVRLGDELERIGYDGDDRGPPPTGLAAALELHVEQGPTLDDAGIPVGVVEGVYGMAWLEARITGESDHAGPTPMHARADALRTAAAAIDAVGDLPARLSADAVATVGRIEAGPGAVNVVPGSATFSIDVRSDDDDVVDRAVEAAAFEVATACERHGTDHELEELWRIPPTEFAPRVRDAVADAAAALGIESRRLVSGAGHDATRLAEVTDAGMVFVPSVDGITHNESEYTEWADCVAGVRTVAETTRRLAG